MLKNAGQLLHTIKGNSLRCSSLTSSIHITGPQYCTDYANSSPVLDLGIPYVKSITLLTQLPLPRVTEVIGGPSIFRYGGPCPTLPHTPIGSAHRELNRRVSRRKQYKAWFVITSDLVGHVLLASNDLVHVCSDLTFHLCSLVTAALFKALKEDAGLLMHHPVHGV